MDTEILKDKEFLGRDLGHYLLEDLDQRQNVWVPFRFTKIMVQKQCVF